MNPVSYEAIKQRAELINEYRLLPDLLRGIAKFAVAEKKYQRQFRDIAKLLESTIPDELFQARYLEALRGLSYLDSGKYLGNEELGAKLGKSPGHAKQLVGALRNGGIDLDESVASGYKVGSQGGRPAQGLRLG
ncbi:MAG: hypothetical protein QNJ46_07975 [Leptolyngbyaceae cyanobacterium MO_188.B28]|nr:hypothetical protein [Leptolyngbyaceae cyanobacterium MO_188.B28]